MSDLVDFAFAGHGGRERWNRLKTIRADITAAGVFLQLKGNPQALTDVSVTVDARSPWVSYAPFPEKGKTGFFTPDSVWIEDVDGKRIDELTAPRYSFEGHKRETHWNDLQVIYFGGYAIWNYLLVPLLFTMPGVECDEIEPYQEAGETWRRLRVRFAADFPTHTPEQSFYFDERGLLRRQDYHVEIAAGGAPTAHYCYDHTNVDGLIFPMRRRALPRLPDGSSAKGPVFVGVDISSVRID